MRFAVESWAPEYGSPLGAESLESSTAKVDPEVELPAGQWQPLSVEGLPHAEVVLFVDGVRRIDAQVWITSSDGLAQPGIAASYAAGVVRCDGVAQVVACQVRRQVFSAAPDLAAITTRHGTYEPCRADGDAPEQLSGQLQAQMGALEAQVAGGCAGADLVVVDGPLNKVAALDCAIGYVKTHHRQYLPPALAAVVGQLQPGERTPLFSATTGPGHSRLSWYARLPGGAGHPWAGIIRGEVRGDVVLGEARRLADLATATLPRYASTAHKDTRAPQNLHPIAGLERTLRRHLGDATLLYRALSSAAAA